MELPTNRLKCIEYLSLFLTHHSLKNKFKSIIIKFAFDIKSLCVSADILIGNFDFNINNAFIAN